MSVDEYKRQVIELLQSGNATPEQWDEAASAILGASETTQEVPAIDAALGIE